MLNIDNPNKRFHVSPELPTMLNVQLEGLLAWSVLSIYRFVGLLIIVSCLAVWSVGQLAAFHLNRN